MTRTPCWNVGRAAAAAVLALLATGCGTRVLASRPSTGPAGTATTPASLTPAQARRVKEAGHTLPPVARKLVKRADFLAGVSCPSAATCVAVGWYYYGAAGPAHALAATWNGAAWRAGFPPSRGHDSEFSGLSCVSPASCLAVGPPAEVWNGTQWAVIPTPGPEGSVSCAAAASCQAVGATPRGRLVAAGWNGRAWRTETVPAPHPAGQVAQLAGVSCPSVSFCMAVGDTSRGVGAQPSPAYRDAPLAETWNGSRWRIVPTPSPSRRAELSAVSCTSPRACVAVGSSRSGQVTLAERWNGRVWSIQRTPNVNRAGDTALLAVSCATPAMCMAVGTYDGGSRAVAERWNGRRWTIQRLPGPAGAAAQPARPASVSCPSQDSCMAVGTAGNRTAAEIWNGTVWTTVATPDPA